MFDTLVESTRSRRSSRTWLYFAVSSAVWTVVLASAAVAGIMTYDGTLDADFENTALVAVVHVTPPPSRAIEHDAVQPATSRRFESQPTQPADIAPPRPLPAPTGGGVPFGSPIGVPGGDLNGIPTGPSELGGGDPTARIDPRTIPPPQPPREPVPDRVDPPAKRLVSKGPLNGVAIHRDQPQFPAIAIAAGVTGTVVVEVTVSEAGDVVSARAISGHPFFTRIAEQSALNWKFSPTTLGGVPVKVVGTITFVFKRNA